MNTSFISEEELSEIGFKNLGKNINLSKNASIFNPELISLGNNVRIDDFCILSGSITIGSFVHIAAYTALYGKAGIFIEDFVNISARVIVYSANDDYSGEYLSSPMVPIEFTNVNEKPVFIKKHAIIGSGSVILPGVTLGRGVAVGALSLVNQSLKPWKIYAGIPCRLIKVRKKNILELARKIEKIT